MRKSRPHQIEAIDFCRPRKDPGLGMDMRLGKTHVAIKILNEKGCKKILVVAPYSALLAWETELALESESNVVFLQGTRKKRRQILTGNKHKWFLLNKEGHLAFRNKGGRTWDSIFTDFPWDAVVLDESTFIRNPKASVTKCYTTHFRRVPHRMIMSGRMNPESDLDFFEQIKFLDSGASLGWNYWVFRARNFHKVGFDWYPNKGTTKKILEAVADNVFIQRRKDVALDQPMVYETRHCLLPEKLLKSYRTAEKEFILEYEGVEKARTMHSIAAYTWLRHLASGFLEGEMVWDGKLKLVEELLEGDLKGEPLVIWFDYNEGLDAVRHRLMARGYSVRSLYGGRSFLNRSTAIRAWNAGRAQILLAQERCATFGSNFSRAQQQIYFTGPLSGEIRKQTEERILVPGRKEPLLTIDLICKETVDEDIYKMVKLKEWKSVSVLDAVRAIAERRTG